jgi:hypothetical protein
MAVWMVSPGLNGGFWIQKQYLLAAQLSVQLSQLAAQGDDWGKLSQTPTFAESERPRDRLSEVC